MNKPQPLCEICQSNEPKYTCPRCSLHTCSLNCFKQHKVEKSCSGVSDASLGTRDKYINKAALNKTDVQRDYNFLIKMNRSLELTKRKKDDNKILMPNKRVNRNRNQLQQRSLISLRGVKVKKVPFGMERGKINKSGGKSNNWFWTVEWLLIDLNFNILQKYIRYRSSEISKIKDLIPQGWINKNEDGTIENYQVLLKNIEKIDTFFDINIESKLSDAIIGRTIIEFPTFYVTKENIEQNKSIDIIPERSNKSESSTSSSDSSTGSSDSDSESNSSDSNSDSDGSRADSDSESDSPPEESSSKKPVDN